MSYIQAAIEQDVKGDYIKASELYERSIEIENFSDAYINLAVLYFQFTDVGINATSHLPLKFIKKSFSRYEEVINEGINKFPNNSEMKFWKKYFNYRAIGDSLSAGEVLDIMKEDESNVIPYFFLYLTEPEKYKNQKAVLINQCHQLLTSKNKWILSIIE